LKITAISVAEQKAKILKANSADSEPYAAKDSPPSPLQI
jgi:hypothetical protein